MSVQRRTKIVATVGPSTDEPPQLERLLEAGVDVLRLNASHADGPYLETMIPRLREVSTALGRTIAILLDLRGPKVRVGRVHGGSVTLDAGTRTSLVYGEFEGDASRIPITYERLAQDVQEGDSLLLDDGLLELKVLSRRGPHEIRTEVLTGGELKSHKGINVPGRPLSTPAFSEKDLDDLKLGVRLGVDLVALSFVRTGDDVRELRKRLHGFGGLQPIIAKIEKPQALDGLEDILLAADGIMVARGDLGVELPPESVPSIQKRIIARANAHGLPVITATQMLESMIDHRRPTRAEASDVANAIFDGTDAIMLSGETAVGRFPHLAVRMMDRIAREAEASEFYGQVMLDESQIHGFDEALKAMAVAARRIAQRVDAGWIAVYTLSGNSARLMSKLRSRRPILALCPDELICRRMALEHGIVPLQVDYYQSTDDMLLEGDRLLLETGLVQPGDRVVVLGGTRQFQNVSNMLQLRVMPEQTPRRGA